MTNTLRAELGSHAERLRHICAHLELLTDHLKEHPSAPAWAAELLAPLVGQLTACSVMPDELVKRLQEVKEQAKFGIVLVSIDRAGVVTFESQQPAGGG